MDNVTNKYFLSHLNFKIAVNLMNITKVYNGKSVVKNLSLGIKKGEIFW